MTRYVNTQEGVEAKADYLFTVTTFLYKKTKKKEFYLPPFSDFSEMLDIFQYAFIWSAFL